MPLAVATDNFNRADGDLGANWSMVIGTKPNVSSNKVGRDTIGEDEIVYWSANNFDTDQYSQAIYSTVEAAGFSGLTVRCQSTTDFISYERNSTNTTQHIYSYDTGVFTDYGSYSGAMANGDTLRLEAEGTVIRAYQNSTLRITSTNYDAHIDGLRYPGMKISENTTDTGRMDDWEGGNLYTTNRLRAFQENSTHEATSGFTESFTIDSVDNSVLYVVVGSRDSSATDLDVSAMTYNGVAMTRVRSDLWNASTYVQTEIWRLVNPPTGTNTLSITLTGAVAFCRANIYHIMTNDQTTPVDVNAGSDNDSSNATSKTINFTPTVDNAVSIDVIWQKDNSDATPGTGQMICAQTSPNAADDRLYTGMKRLGSAGAKSVSYTWTNSDGYAISVAALKPYVAAASSVVKDVIGVGVVPFQR